MKKSQMLQNVMLFIGGMLEPLVKVGASVLIGIYSSPSCAMKIMYMGGAYVGISVVEIVIEKVYSIVKRRLVQKRKIQNLKNTEERQQGNSDESVYARNYARTLDSNHMVEAETCIEYSSQQLDELLNESNQTLKNLQISEYKLELNKLLYKIFLDRQTQDRLQNQIAITNNKQELIKLKQELMKTQFGLQDYIAEYNHLIENAGKGEKVKTS